MEEKPESELRSPSARSKPGPRTPYGKRNSKYNAIKTGIFAKVILTSKPFSERREDFETLLAGLRRAIPPRDQMEEMLLETLALELFKLVRIYQADAEVAPLLFQKIRECLDNGSDGQAVAPLLGGQAPKEEKLPTADVLMRYETAAWGHVDKILGRIERWRRFRARIAATDPSPGGRS